MCKSSITPKMMDDMPSSDEPIQRISCNENLCPDILRRKAPDIKPKALQTSKNEY